MADTFAIGFNQMYLDRPEVALHCAEPEHAPLRSPSRRLRAYASAIGKQLIPRPEQINYVAVPDKRAEAAREHMRLYENIEVTLEDARAIAVLQDLLQRETRARDYVVLID